MRLPPVTAWTAQLKSPGGKVGAFMGEGGEAGVGGTVGGGVGVLAGSGDVGSGVGSSGGMGVGLGAGSDVGLGIGASVGSCEGLKGKGWIGGDVRVLIGWDAGDGGVDSIDGAGTGDPYH